MINFRPSQEKRYLWHAGKVSLLTALILSFHLFWHQVQPSVKPQLQTNQVAQALYSSVPIFLTVVDIFMVTCTVFTLSLAGRAAFRILKYRNTEAYWEAERREASLVQAIDRMEARHCGEEEVDLAQAVREIEQEYARIEYRDRSKSTPLPPAQTYRRWLFQVEPRGSDRFRVEFWTPTGEHLISYYSFNNENDALNWARQAIDEVSDPRSTA